MLPLYNRLLRRYTHFSRILFGRVFHFFKNEQLPFAESFREFIFMTRNKLAVKERSGGETVCEFLFYVHTLPEDEMSAFFDKCRTILQKDMYGGDATGKNNVILCTMLWVLCYFLYTRADNSTV